MTVKTLGDAVGGTFAVDLNLALGKQASTDSKSVTLSNEDTAAIGSSSETAPANDTAQSGLNGRMQRIAQRLSSLIALLPSSLGPKAGSASLAVALSNEDKAYIDGIETALATLNTATASLLTAAQSTAPVPIELPGGGETVAASQTQVMGASGATGDYLSHVTIIPASTSPGAVQIKDGGGTAFTVFAGGASSVSSLVPFVVPVGMKSIAGAWTIITNANVSAIAAGSFT